MDVINWFLNLDHEVIETYVYAGIGLLILPNLINKNLNINCLFVGFLIINISDLLTSYRLIEYLNNDTLKGYRWLQYWYFSIFNVLSIYVIIKRKSFLSRFGYASHYRLYTQEFGLVIIASFSLILQLLSSSNYLFYNATGEYSLFIHGMYGFLKTILLGLNNFIFISLTLQNIYGLLKNNKNGVLRA